MADTTNKAGDRPATQAGPAPAGQQQQAGDADKAGAADAKAGDVKAGVAGKAASGRAASATFGDKQKAAAVRKFYPGRPEVAVERDTIDALIFRDKQGREISVERFSPGDFAEAEADEG